MTDGNVMGPGQAPDIPQEPLGPEFERVLADNFTSLARRDAKPVAERLREQAEYLRKEDGYHAAAIVHIAANMERAAGLLGASAASPDRGKEMVLALERARGCIEGLLRRTPVRDVAETLAEIDAALASAATADTHSAA